MKNNLNPKAKVIIWRTWGFRLLCFSSRHWSCCCASDHFAANLLKSMVSLMLGTCCEFLASDSVACRSLSSFSFILSWLALQRKHQLLNNLRSNRNQGLDVKSGSLWSKRSQIFLSSIGDKEKFEAWHSKSVISLSNENIARTEPLCRGKLK